MIYVGSHLFEPISDSIGLTVYQVRITKLGVSPSLSLFVFSKILQFKNFQVQFSALSTDRLVSRSRLPPRAATVKRCGHTLQATHFGQCHRRLVGLLRVRLSDISHSLSVRGLLFPNQSVATKACAPVSR